MHRSARKVAFSLLVLAFSCSADDNRDPRECFYRGVLIVGAGFAGQAAAVRLIENGFTDVRILEAENRTGGRVHSVPFSDGFVDLGAAWVQGEGGNVIYEMTKGHIDHGDSGYGNFSEISQLSNGKPVDQDLYKKLNPLFDRIIFDLSDNASKYDGSLGNFFIENFNREIQAQNLTDVPEDVRKQMLSKFEKLSNGMTAAPTWFDVAAKGDMYSKTENEEKFVSWKKLGFKTGFDFLTKKLPDPSKAVDVDSKILLNKEVTNIKWDPEEYMGKIEVTCADGTSYFTDHVIFTASLGVLKARHETLFTPKLPENKIKAIDTLGFGNLGKFFLEYEKPFLEDGYYGFTYLWTDEDTLELTGTDKEWLLSVIMVARVDSFPNLLEGAVVGKNIEKFEQLSDEKLLEDVQWLMERFAGKTLPKPINMTRNRWATKKNFLGTYSYPSIAAERENATMDDLAETLYGDIRAPKILFAGEATIKEFYGYTHGAVSSGFRAADEILKFHEGSCFHAIIECHHG